MEHVVARVSLLPDRAAHRVAGAEDLGRIRVLREQHIPAIAFPQHREAGAQAAPASVEGESLEHRAMPGLQHLLVASPAVALA